MFNQVNVFAIITFIPYIQGVHQKVYVVDIKSYRVFIKIAALDGAKTSRVLSFSIKYTYSSEEHNIIVILHPFRPLGMVIKR